MCFSPRPPRLSGRSSRVRAPVCQDEGRFDLLEVPRVVGDEDSPERQSVGGDHHVQLADQAARGDELMADAGVLVRRFGIPGESLDDAEKVAHASVQPVAGREAFQTVE